MRDVARAAGVGTTTVSRVINGAQYVDAKTLARVRAVIDQLGYLPSQAARALKGDRTHCIGIIAPTLLDPFFARTINAVQKVAREQGTLLITLASEDDPRQTVLELNTFHGYRIDGLLIVPPAQQTRHFLSAVQDLGIPSVAVDRPINRNYSSVTCDNYEASRDAVKHLIEHGCRSIVCFGGTTELHTIQERVRGYNDAVREAKLKPQVLTGVTQPEMASALEKLFKGRRLPDAVFSLYGDATIAAYEFFADSPLRIPDDVRLLGFDDFKLADKLRPSISVVRQEIDEIGRAAAKLLFEEIKQQTFGPKSIIVPAKLVLRESCGCHGR